MEWRTIETAPKEGVFLVYMPAEADGDRIHAAKWHPKLTVIGGVFSFDRSPPTHWMPLPPTPEGATQHDL